MSTCKNGSANNIFNTFLSRNVTWYFAYSVHLLLLPVQGGSPVGQRSELSSLCLWLRLLGQRIGSLLHIHSDIGLATPFYTCNWKLRVYFSLQWPQNTLTLFLLCSASNLRRLLELFLQIRPTKNKRSPLVSIRTYKCVIQCAVIECFQRENMSSMFFKYHFHLLQK